LRYIISILIPVFLIISCSLEDEGDKNPFKQEHIPWPSLADSPWPMFHGDPQSTDRFDGKGPSLGRLNYFFTAEKYNYGSVSIGHDDCVIFASSYDVDEDNPASWLYCINKNGEMLWKTDIYNGSHNGEIGGSPLITSDGTVIIGSNDQNLYCIDEKTGDIIWIYNTGAPVYTSPAISPEGTILIATSGEEKEILAINSDGTLLWRKEQPLMMGFAFSPDGETFYIGGPRAYDLLGNEIWKSEEHQIAYPCVDNSGNIFGIDAWNDVVVSYDPAGSLRWIISVTDIGFEEPDVSIAPTLDIDGNLLISGWGTDIITEQKHGYISSISSTGKHLWTISLGNETSMLGSHMVSDNEGTVFVSGFFNGSSLTVIDNNGSIQWSIKHDEYGTYGSPAFNSEGTLFLLPEWHEVPAKVRKVM